MVGITTRGTNPTPSSHACTRTQSRDIFTVSRIHCSRSIPACRTLLVTSSLTKSLRSSSNVSWSSDDSSSSERRAEPAASEPAGNRASSFVCIGHSERGEVLDELEPLVEHCDQEDPMDHLRSRDDRQAPAVPAGPAVGVQHQTESRGVEKGESAQIEDQNGRLIALHGQQGLLGSIGL